MLSLVPIKKWTDANTNLLVISLDRNTRKYKQQLIKFTSDAAFHVQTTEDYIANTRLLLGVPTNDLKKQLNKVLKGHEHYFYLVKANETFSPTEVIPHRCLIAELLLSYYKHKGVLEVEHNAANAGGFMICQQNSPQAAARLSDAVLNEPNIHSDFVNQQSHLLAMMRSYCDHLYKVERVELS